MRYWATLGESSENPETIRKMFENGMTGIRLDLTGRTLESYAPLLEIVRAAAAEARTEHYAVAMDMQGPDESDPDSSVMTEEDRRSIAQAARYGVTHLMQPFVRGKEDVAELREELARVGNTYLPIMSKIENRAGLDRLREIVDCSDEICAARGDLGRNIPLWELPAAQKAIGKACREAGKPMLVVNQLLASMERAETPTRAEVCDIYNAVLDGADTLLLVAETKKGAQPAEAIRWLKLVGREAEKNRIFRP